MPGWAILIVEAIEEVPKQILGRDAEESDLIECATVNDLMPGSGCTGSPINPVPGDGEYYLKGELMKPLFTIHAGEYLVGSYIEHAYPKWRVWVPSKDTGVDLLVTDSRNRKAVSIQVKFSKDFNPTNYHILVQNKLMAVGWWTHQELKIKKSGAHLWLFVLPSFIEHETSFIIIPPTDLLQRLRTIHGKAGKRIHSYLWVTKTGRCWETRGLAKADQELIAFDRFSSDSRDFTPFLNAWHQIEKRLK